MSDSTGNSAWRKRCIAAGLLATAAGHPVPVFAGEDDWKVNLFYENDTRARGRDASGDVVGLSKFRNTFQLEADRKFDAGWSLRGIFRGTWDGVYELNSKEYGREAGGPVTLQNSAYRAFVGSPFTNLAQPFVPFGGGINQSEATALGLPPSNAFGFNSSNPAAANYNPNAGLQVLGQRWHRTDQGGVEFAVPVRPCNVDSRGCRDFGGYGDLSLNELQFPEFNSRLDFLRELYVRNTIPLGADQALFIKVGRQQVVWGRTDLFRVLDVINPVDYSRNNIYDELEDIRIPMWMVQTEYRMGASRWMQDSNLQLVWNVDRFRPDNLGQCGTPNVILDGGCFFRGAVNLWNAGGTVANFAPVPPGTPGAWAATDFGPHQVGIRNVDLPTWNLSSTQIGAKFEGVANNGVSFSVNALTYRSQLPSLRAFNTGPINPFTGAVGNTLPFVASVPVARLIAFDMVYPRVNLLGGSMDFQIPAIKSAIRIETAFTNGEEFPNTLRGSLYSKNPVNRSVIGVDRPTFLPFFDKRAALISGQLFYQHIFAHEVRQATLGMVGMPDWKDNFILTLLIRQPMMNDHLNPQILFARDFMARAFVVGPSLNWLATNDLSVTFGANIKAKSASALDNWQFDDCRSCNPYPPFTTYTGAGQGFTSGSLGLGGLEPLGRFRAGPIGAAWAENEIHLTLKYRF